TLSQPSDTAQIPRPALVRGIRQLKLITDRLPALISYIDRDIRFVYNNRTYEDWLGLPLSEITGHRLEEIYGLSFEKIRPPIERALSGESGDFETEFYY